MSYALKIEKKIARPVSDVFHALKGGLLFMNCSGDSNTMKIDFRVGGQYRIDFRGHEKYNFGEFLEIVPDKKIVFSWCQAFGPNEKPDTRVSIELFADGASQTRLLLEHSGFRDKAVCDAHEMGWTSGLTDMAGEMESGRLRMTRRYDASVDKVYAICKDPASFFAYMGDVTKGKVDFRVGGQYQVPTKKGEIKGEFTEIVPNEKISLTWLVGCSGPLKGSSVTLAFKTREQGGSLLELTHNGLLSSEEQMAHRRGWEVVTQKVAETLR